jgi:hypothetical protein
VRGFENRVLRGTFGPERDRRVEKTTYVMGSFIICTHSQILLRLSNQG